MIEKPTNSKDKNKGNEVKVFDALQKIKNNTFQMLNGISGEFRSLFSFREWKSFWRDSKSVKKNIQTRFGARQKSISKGGEETSGVGISRRGLITGVGAGVVAANSFGKSGPLGIAKNITSTLKAPTLSAETLNRFGIMTRSMRSFKLFRSDGFNSTNSFYLLNPDSLMEELEQCLDPKKEAFKSFLAKIKFFLPEGFKIEDLQYSEELNNLADDKDATLKIKMVLDRLEKAFDFKYVDMKSLEEAFHKFVIKNVNTIAETFSSRLGTSFDEKQLWDVFKDLGLNSNEIQDISNSESINKLIKAEIEKRKMEKTLEEQEEERVRLQNEAESKAREEYWELKREEEIKKLTQEAEASRVFVNELKKLGIDKLLDKYYVRKQEVYSNNQQDVFLFTDSIDDESDNSIRLLNELRIVLQKIAQQKTDKEEKINGNLEDLVSMAGSTLNIKNTEDPNRFIVIFDKSDPSQNELAGYLKKY